MVNSESVTKIDELHIFCRDHIGAVRARNINFPWQGVHGNESFRVIQCNGIPKLLWFPRGLTHSQILFASSILFYYAWNVGRLLFIHLDNVFIDREPFSPIFKTILTTLIYFHSSTQGISSFLTLPIFKLVLV